MIKLRKLLQDTVGANLVEYIILVGVIALVALAGFKSFGKSIDTKIKQQQKKVLQIGTSSSSSSSSSDSSSDSSSK
jgi:Flp pilus assembly pilin Flp